MFLLFLLFQGSSIPLPSQFFADSSRYLLIFFYTAFPFSHLSIAVHQPTGGLFFNLSLQLHLTVAFPFLSPGNYISPFHGDSPEDSHLQSLSLTFIAELTNFRIDKFPIFHPTDISYSYSIRSGTLRHSCYVRQGFEQSCDNRRNLLWHRNTSNYDVLQLKQHQHWQYPGS